MKMDDLSLEKRVELLENLITKVINGVKFESEKDEYIIKKLLIKYYAAVRK
jgi:hypothetical protein